MWGPVELIGVAPPISMGGMETAGGAPEGEGDLETEDRATLEAEEFEYHSNELDLTGDPATATGRSAAWTCTSASAGSPS